MTLRLIRLKIHGAFKSFVTKVRERWKAYTFQEKVLLTLFHFILLLFAIYAILPIFYAVINSFKTVDDYYTSSMALPRKWEWANFVRAFDLTYRGNNVYQMLFTTVIFVITFLCANMFSSVETAYVISKFRFFGRNFLYALAIAVQIIPIFGTLGTAYLVCDTLGLIDNIWLLWITGASGFDYTFLIVFSYFETIDRSYSESAKIDGAGNFTIFYKIMVPMVMPSILIMGLSNLIALWNDYATSLIYLPNHPTIATGLYNLKTAAAYEQGGATLYFATVVITIIPILLIYILSQKAIMKLSFEGGIKG